MVSCPLVTAVVTTYNRPSLARRAISSAIHQTYEPLEVIVVEDGSDTGLQTWLLSKEGQPIRYVCHEQNQGLAAARNTGLALARGEYVAFLDDDDEWKPQRIARQMQLLLAFNRTDRARIGVVYCGQEVHFVDRSYTTISHPCNDGSLRDSILRHGLQTLQSTALFRRGALCKIGGYDETLSSSIDDDIWMALAAHGYEVRALDEPLVIVYEDHFRKRMTNDATQRIRGVGQYIRKWSSTYNDWLGPELGVRYGQRYTARVIATLAATKCVTGEVPQAWQAIRTIFRTSPDIGYNLVVLFKALAVFAALRFMPDWMLYIGKAVKG